MHPAFRGFLDEQAAALIDLARASDLFDVGRIDEQHFLLSFFTKGLVRNPDGEIVEHSRWDVGLFVPGTYLSSVDPFQLLTLVQPLNAFMSNVRSPGICIGPVVPGTPLVSIMYRVHEVLGGMNDRPDDPLNLDASNWALVHPERFPVDDRPLKRRRSEALVFDAIEVTA